MSVALASLLEITIYSAVLYVAVLLVKKIFYGHLSPVLQYAVWWLFILRLLVPVMISSGIHLIVVPFSPTATSETVANTVSAVSGSSAFSQVAANKAPDAAAVGPSGGVDGTSPFSPPQIDWQTVLVLIWAAGVLASTVYRTVLWRRFNRKLCRSGIPTPPYLTEMVETCKKELGIRAHIDISMQDSLHSPALSSALKPKLLLPETMLQTMDEWQMKCGIRHELTHYRRKDYLANLLLIVLRCVYWFNPIVWVAFPQIQADMEAACDASVTGDMETEEKTRYAETLINFGSNRDLQYTLGMGAHLGRKTMEKRIRSIFMTKKTRYPIRLAVLLLTAALLVACFTTACSPVQGAAASSDSPVSSINTALNNSTAGNALDTAVSNAILSRLDSSPFGEKKTEGHVTLGTATDKSGGTLVYVVASYAAFGFENNVFTITSGCGAIPAVIRFSNSGSDYSPESYTEPEAVDGNQESIRSMFPEQYRSDAQNASQYLSELQKQQEEQAKAYLKKIGRNSQIQLSGVTKKSFNISAKASNALVTMKDLSDYPSWIGTREEVVSGTRTVYEADEQDLSGYSFITYTKKSAGGNILQQMQFKVTGDQVVRQGVSSTTSSASANSTVSGTVTDATMNTITIKVASGSTYTLLKDNATVIVKSNHGIRIGDTAEIVYSGELKNGSAQALIITINSNS